MQVNIVPKKVTEEKQLDYQDNPLITLIMQNMCTLMLYMGLTEIQMGDDGSRFNISAVLYDGNREVPQDVKALRVVIIDKVIKSIFEALNIDSCKIAPEQAELDLQADVFNKLFELEGKLNGNTTT